MQGHVFDDRPKLQKMRRVELWAILKDQGWPAEQAEQLTKDECLVAIGARQYVPQTVKLGQNPQDVPIREWPLNALRAEAKKRGHKLPFGAGKETILAVLEGKAQPGFVPETDEQKAAESF